MTQKDFQSRMANLSKGGVVQAERLGRFQAELFEKFQEVNRHWLERVQSEATLAVEFARQMALARSFPDAATFNYPQFRPLRKNILLNRMNRLAAIWSSIWRRRP